MTTIGKFFNDLGWPFHFLLLAGFLILLFAIIWYTKKYRPYVGQLLIAAGILWIGTVFYFITFSFPVSRFAADTATDAATIPRFWFYALVPTMVLALVPIFRRKEEPDPKWGNMRLLALVFGSLVIHLGLITYIGYYISTAMFIVTLMWLLGSRSKIELAAVPAGWLLFSYFVFARLLHVRLPVGMIFSGIFG